jgi:hypothetical protein
MRIRAVVSLALPTLQRAVDWLPEMWPTVRYSTRIWGFDLGVTGMSVGNMHRAGHAKEMASCLMSNSCLPGIDVLGSFAVLSRDRLCQTT